MRTRNIYHRKRIIDNKKVSVIPCDKKVSVIPCDKKVSIVIPCYNYANWLPEAIESALNQTYKNIEVIVVNDGSTDNTNEVAKRYSVGLIEKINGGLGSARNTGIRIATGYYILPLDADDKINPSYIEKTIGVDDIVSTWLKEFGDSSEELHPMDNPQINDFIETNRINYCSLYKKEIWEKIGGYDECELMRNGFEDWDFWLRAAKAGYHITVVKEPLFFYRKHGNSLLNKAISKCEELKSYILKK